MGWQVAASGIWQVADQSARNQQLRFQLDSGREHPHRDMS
eukprot:gene27038-biopygen17604